MYDMLNLIAELNQDDQLIQTYIWGIDLNGTRQGAGGAGGLLLVNSHSESISYMSYYDDNGNITAYVDTDGDILASLEYSPFGEIVSGELPCPFGFSTKYTDSETGLLYYGFRYYDSEMGRWLNRDPIGEEGGWNLYDFVHNNAILYYDSTGLKPPPGISTILNTTIKFLLKHYDKERSKTISYDFISGPICSQGQSLYLVKKTTFIETVKVRPKKITWLPVFPGLDSATNEYSVIYTYECLCEEPFGWNKYTLELESTPWTYLKTIALIPYYYRYESKVIYEYANGYGPFDR